VLKQLAPDGSGEDRGVGQGFEPASPA
jgi:hypothetical protein